MRSPLRYSDWILNLLVAAAISTVVNFSYVLLLIVDQRVEQQRPAREHLVQRPDEGRLTITPDGHGYVVYENGDSIYAPMNRIRRLGLADGDRLVVNLLPNRTAGAHPMLSEVRKRNGADFDYSTVFNRPSAGADITVQLLYYLVLSFVLLAVTAIRRKDILSKSRAQRLPESSWPWRSISLLRLSIGVRAILCSIFRPDGCSITCCC